MSISNTERRLIENEMIFRRSNEKVGAALSMLDAMHIEDGNEQLIKDEDLIFRFKCECADEQCSIRIPMRLSEYQSLHANRYAFIVVPGHQVDPIETVVSKTDGYFVVEKDHVVTEPSEELHETAVNNV